MPWPSTRRARLVMRLVFYSLVIFIGLPFAFSQVMIRTYPRPTEPPPAGAEEVRMLSEGLRLRGWLFRGEAGRAAVVVAHGVGDSIESYAGVAAVLRKRGHTVLLVDLRGHGGSEGTRCTLGGREREDVRSAMALVTERGLAGSGLVVMGYSMGAVAALRAAAGRADVRAVVVEAPYDTYRENVVHHAWLVYRIPRWVPIIPLSVALAEWRAGFAADEVDAVAAARDIRAPLLAIVDGADDRMPERVVRRVYDAHPGPKRFWVAPGAGHVGAMLDRDYWPHVLGFLEAQGL